MISYQRLKPGLSHVYFPFYLSLLPVAHLRAMIYVVLDDIIPEAQTWFVTCLFSIYLSLLPVAHLSNAPWRRLVVMEDSARIEDETTESSTWFFNLLGVSHCHMGAWFKVSSEGKLVTVRLASLGIKPTTLSFQVRCSTN